jgi:hypothetical protein
LARPELRRLADVLRWQIQEHAAAGDLDAAIQAAVLSSKVGFDLTSGNPRDASLGLVIVDNARKALLPYLGAMNAKQLSTLARSLKKVFLGRPPFERAMQAAGYEMLDKVEQIQNAYRDQSFEGLRSDLGTSSKSAIGLLTDLHRQSDEKRVRFFEGLVDDAKQAADVAVEDARIPAKLRSTTRDSAVEEGPWKRIGARYFESWRPLMEMNDATVARTRLLILTAEIDAILKTSGRTPDSLRSFTAALTVDPYTGEPFIYRTDGRGFKLYSTGADFQDNGGLTDEAFSNPDLLLEIDKSN